MKIGMWKPKRSNKICLKRDAKRLHEESLMSRRKKREEGRSRVVSGREEEKKRKEERRSEKIVTPATRDGLFYKEDVVLSRFA